MALKLKVIKSKAFKANEEDHTHYSCAYKGRIFGISTLRLESKDFTVKDNMLTLHCDVEVLRNESTDPLTGKHSVFLDIVPKIDLNLADF